MTLFAPMGMVTDNTSFSCRGGTDNKRGQWLYADKDGLGMLDSKLSYNQKCVTEEGAAGSLLAFDGPDVFGFYQDPGAPQTDLFGRHGGKRWEVKLPPRHEVRLTGILLAGDKLFVGGVTGGEEARGKLDVFSTTDGKKLGETDLPSGVRWDGLAAAGDRLYVAGEAGVLSCLTGR